MEDPDDTTLSEFMFRFVGWERENPDNPYWWVRENHNTSLRECIPNYLEDLNVWMKDIWPKICTLGIQYDVCHHVLNINGYDGRGTYNFVQVGLEASAKDRCLALYRALQGQLAP